MREDYIQSAVQFLKEPQVTSASVAKKVEFLESKGLTAEEIQETLRRVAGPTGSSSSSSGSASPNAPPAQYVPPRPSYMMQQPPPIPERDWKDYFVMATVSVGVAYGIYEVARRYVLPMILPPTPASLEADKEELEEEFQRTEALVKQLQEDTAEMRAQEEARSEEFARVMNEAREVIGAIKQHAEERKQESKLALSNVESLRELIPRSLQQHSDTQKRAIVELQEELKSLKQLMGRRTSGSFGMPVPPASSVPSSLPGFQRKPRDPNSAATSTAPATSTPAAAPSSAPGPSKPAAKQDAEKAEQTEKTDAPFIPDPEKTADASESSSKPALPAWQLAAMKSE